MIRLNDASLLAITKLRTRRVRTSITVIISGLVFGCLVAGLLTGQGALNSVNKFNAEGLGSRYIVQANSVGTTPTTSASLKDRALQIYNQTIADKKVAAKKLDLTYDPTSEVSPILTFPGSKAGGETFLDQIAPSAQQAIAEYLQAHPFPSLPDLKQVAKSYHPSSLYSATPLQANNGVLTSMTNGVENFTLNDPQNNQQPSSDIFLQNQFSFMSAGLTQPFLLPNLTNATNSDAIPLIVPYGTATKLLGLPELPKAASPTQKLSRIKQLYAKAGTVQFAACYRNTVSAGQIQQALTAAADIAKNAGNKDYQKPNLIYGLPAADSCAPAPVISDTRTKAEKTDAANLDTFNAEFGQTVQPDQQKLSFRIVGLEPDYQNNAPSDSAAGIFQNLVGSSLAGALAIPQDLYNSLPSVSRYNQILTSRQQDFYASSNSYYAEFTSAQTARVFIHQKGCTPDHNGQCTLPDKPFQLNPFGSNSIALQDLQHKFSRVFVLAALIAAAIAIVIMAGTIGRMLADGRRETAVFRAIGAKRLDITAIYSFYTLLLSLLVALFAVLLGVGVAMAADRHLWPSTTVQAQLAFGGSKPDLQFHFIGYTPKIWLVALGAIGCGLISMLLPLVRNIRRSPIKDMRDE